MDILKHLKKERSKRIKRLEGRLITIKNNGRNEDDDYGDLIKDKWEIGRVPK